MNIKPTTKIKQDSHGLYVKTNGSVFRPIPSKWSSPHPSAIAPDNPYNERWRQTLFKEGDAVAARHVSQTIFCRVQDNDRLEFWHSHGSYYTEYDKTERRMTIRKTDEVWEPKEGEEANQ